MIPEPVAAWLLFLNRVAQKRVNVVNDDEYKIKNKVKTPVSVLFN